MRLSSLLEIPLAAPSAASGIVDLTGADAVQVGLHHHREQGTVDAPATLEDRRDQAALAQLGDLQLDVPGLGGQQPVTMAVALRGARLGALVAAGADAFGCLRFDQRLQHELDTLADHVDIAAGADSVQQLVHVKLGQGHRAPPKLDLLRQAEDHPVAPPQWWTPPASTPLGGTSTIAAKSRVVV
jgi:hypothetical protein